MWQTIWTWDLIAFGVSHAASGMLAAFRFRKQLRRYAFALPLGFTFLGLLIPATAGLITALLIAGIYVRAGFEMTTTEVREPLPPPAHALHTQPKPPLPQALAWGVGQFVLYTVSTYSPSYSTL
jgi:hypothetical protein